MCCCIKKTQQATPINRDISMKKIVYDAFLGLVLQKTTRNVYFNQKRAYLFYNRVYFCYCATTTTRFQDQFCKKQQETCILTKNVRICFIIECIFVISFSYLHSQCKTAMVATQGLGCLGGFYVWIIGQVGVTALMAVFVLMVVALCVVIKKPGVVIVMQSRLESNVVGSIIRMSKSNFRAFKVFIIKRVLKATLLYFLFLLLGVPLTSSASNDDDSDTGSILTQDLTEDN